MRDKIDNFCIFVRPPQAFEIADCRLENQSGRWKTKVVFECLFLFLKMRVFLKMYDETEIWNGRWWRLEFACSKKMKSKKKNEKRRRLQIFKMNDEKRKTKMKDQLRVLTLVGWVFIEGLLK